MESGLTVVKDESEYIEIVQHLRAQFAQGQSLPKADDITSRRWMKLRCIYYYSVRCSMQPIAAAGAFDSTMRTALASLREGFMADANVLVTSHVLRDDPIAPKWFNELIAKLRTHPDATTAALAQATDFVLDVNAAVRVGIDCENDRWRVSLPSMLKSYLGQLAQVFLNPIYVEEGHDDDGRRAEDAADILLHMLWFSREEFNPIALPAIHPQSVQKHELALAVADVQLAYLCLHEIAHAALGHTTEDGSVPASRPEGQRFAYKIRAPDGNLMPVSSSIPIDEPFADPAWEVSIFEQEEVDADAWAEARLRQMGWSPDLVTLAVDLSTRFLVLSKFVCLCRFVDGQAVKRPVSKELEQRLWRSRLSGQLASVSPAVREIVDWSDHLSNVVLYRLGRLTKEDVTAFGGIRPWD